MTDKLDNNCPLYKDGCAHGEKDENNCNKKGNEYLVKCRIFRDYLEEHPLR